MRTPRRFGAYALLFAAVLVLAATAGADAPLTDEDIVRGFVTGQSVEQLIEWIQGSEVDFDLSREMLEELRAARLPDAVIEAMKLRQAAVDEANRPPAVAETPTPAGTVVVLLNPIDVDAEAKAKKKTPPVLRFLDTVPPGLAQSLSLAADDRRFTDAAIFLGCTNTRHVPDQWRSKTPLGRDFVNAPRHRLLAWVSGVHEVDRKKLGKFLARLAPGPDSVEPKVLELEIPERLEASLEVTEEPDEMHDLILGVALQAGGRFYMLSADTWDGVQLDARGELSATLNSGDGPLSPEFEVRFRRE